MKGEPCGPLSISFAKLIFTEIRPLADSLQAVGWMQFIMRCLGNENSRWATAGQRTARTSAAPAFGFFVRAFLVVFRILASRKPACLNSFRKAPLSLAPLIQANQSASVGVENGVTYSVTMSSAA